MLFCFSCDKYQQNSREIAIMQHQAKIASFEGQEVYYILSKGEIEPHSKDRPNTFYIEGSIREGRFFPKSKVLGVGDLGKDGRYGWLELNTNEFSPMESGKGAVTPFVKGYQSQSGSFVPSDREVYTTP